MSLRLSEEQAAELTAVARADRVSISEVIREAVDHHIESRKRDKAFKERLKERLEEDREIIERLAK